MQMEDLIELAKRVQVQQAEAQTVEVKAAHRGCPSKLRDTLSQLFQPEQRRYSPVWTG